MRRLIRHIEECLLAQECVVVPGIGAFIKQRHAAQLDEAQGLIYPSSASLSFNAQLKQGDGVLVESYRRSFALSYKKALTLVESDVTQLQELLQRSSMVALGALGRLSLDTSSGRITFVPNSDHHFATHSFGLAAVPTLTQLSTPAITATKGHAKGVLYLPIHTRAIKYTAAAAAALTLALLIPTQSISLPESTHSAGYFSALFQAEQPQRQSEASAPVVAVPTPSAEASTMTAIEEAARGTYTVVATFKSKAGVSKWMETHTLTAGGGVLAAPGSYKIYTAYHTTIKEAQQALAASDLSAEEVWLYQLK